MSGRYLPIEYDVSGRSAAVLGADETVLSVVDRLLDADADVTIYRCGGDLDRGLGELCELVNVAVLDGTPGEDELEHFSLVFASPRHEALSARLHAWARERGRLFCTIDRPERATFVTPTAAEVGGIGLRLFSPVVSQALVKKLALDLAVALAGDEMLRFVDRLGELRAELPFEGHAERMSEAVRGFVLEASLRFPAWFQRGDDRP